MRLRIGTCTILVVIAFVNEKCNLLIMVHLYIHVDVFGNYKIAVIQRGVIKKKK